MHLPQYAHTLPSSSLSLSIGPADTLFFFIAPPTSKSLCYSLCHFPSSPSLTHSLAWSVTSIWHTPNLFSLFSPQLYPSLSSTSYSLCNFPSSACLVLPKYSLSYLFFQYNRSLFSLFYSLFVTLRLFTSDLTLISSLISLSLPSFNSLSCLYFISSLLLSLLSFLRPHYITLLLLIFFSLSSHCHTLTSFSLSHRLFSSLLVLHSTFSFSIAFYFLSQFLLSFNLSLFLSHLSLPLSPPPSHSSIFLPLILFSLFY